MDYDEVEIDEGYIVNFTDENDEPMDDEYNGHVVVITSYEPDDSVFLGGLRGVFADGTTGIVYPYELTPIV